MLPSLGLRIRLPFPFHQSIKKSGDPVNDIDGVSGVTAHAMFHRKTKRQITHEQEKNQRVLPPPAMTPVDLPILGITGQMFTPLVPS